MSTLPKVYQTKGWHTIGTQYRSDSQWFSYNLINKTGILLFVRYKNVKSLFYAPDTNITNIRLYYQLYLNKKHTFNILKRTENELIFQIKNMVLLLATTLHFFINFCTLFNFRYYVFDFEVVCTEAC